MKKRVMWLIIVVMAISMVGIGIIQMIWFGTAIDQDKKNFDDKVTIALGIVKERLLEDAQNEKYAIEQFRSNKSRSGADLKTDFLSENKLW